MNLDEYQIQHAKNFQYRYYPPRLVELERSHMQNHDGSHGHNAYDSNYEVGASQDHHSTTDGHNHDYAYNQYANASTKAGASLVKWAIILLVLLLALFLILGVVGMQGSSSANAGKAGGGRRG